MRVFLNPDFFYFKDSVKFKIILGYNSPGFRDSPAMRQEPDFSQITQ